MYRTHTCEELTSQHIGQTVKLAGWVNRRRDHGGLIFIDLRDRFDITQVVFNPEKNPEAHTTAETLRSEWVIQIEGTVIPRAEGMANPKMKTGEIEVEVNQITILSEAKNPPFSICDEKINVNEELRLKYRYLDLRRGRLTQNLLLRNRAMMVARNYLDAQGFPEVTTPFLGKSTPEGSRDYLVPSRLSPGSFYALPQSPQLYKQILMVAGMDKYYQFATCLRDEDLRANRQPEFTQIDMEMSFGTPDDLFPIVEGLMQEIFNKTIDVKIQAPFLRMTYDDCMEKYGTDKPDLRFGMPLVRIDHIAERSSFSVFKEVIANGGVIKGLCVQGGADISRKGIDTYTDFVGRLGIKGLAWMKVSPEGELTSNIVKFFDESLQKELIEAFGCQPNDILFMVADRPNAVNQALDHLRRQIARDRNLIDPNKYSLLWVTDFPLFNWNEDEGRIESEHHPFTSPHPEDIPLLDTDPLKVRSSSYDLVLNGHETSSGSQRIHDSRLQQKIFEVLNLNQEELEERFGFFLEALNYGTPPHLGMALGFDRIIMVLTQTENIRDVIAFPKSSKASDLMTEAPSSVDKEQLAELRLKLDTIMEELS